MYKMKLWLGKITIFLFSLILIIGIVHTIGYSNNKQFVIKIFAAKEHKKDLDQFNDDKDKSNKEEKNVEILKDNNNTFSKCDVNNLYVNI